jgi:hypothetical protein
MATFEAPNYVIGNSSTITAQLSSVLTTLDQALQALQPAPNATTVKFNDTIILDNGGTDITNITNTTITKFESGIGTMTYMPSFDLQAVSNQSIQIPPFNAVPHQVILQSAPVPLIDTLNLLPWTISGEQVNTYAFNGTSDMYLGCESGNIYWYNTSNLTWDLMLTFDGSIRCLYFHNQSGRMYIGGKFGNMTYPFSFGGINALCFSNTFPNLDGSISVDVWANYGVNGFDAAVNAITGDGTYLYFGGEYKYIYGGGLNAQYITCFEWSGSQFIYAFDNTNGYGFDAYVYGLSLISDRLCVTGNFNNVISNMGYTTALYCVSITLIAGYIVNSTEFLYGNPTALTMKIDILDSIKNDGNVFYISTSDPNINGLGVNYMIQAPYYAFSSSSACGNNEYLTRQTSFNLQGGTPASVGGDAIYLISGIAKATFSFTPYMYWNYAFGREEFIDMGNGQIYAFNGSTQNQFTLQNSRSIVYQGSTSTQGWVFTPSGNGYGISTVLYWNGGFYIPIATTGGNPF